VIHTQSVHEPLRPARLGVRLGPAVLIALPVVVDVATRALNRGHSIALDVRAVDRPPEPATDDEHEDDELTHAHLKAGPPGASLGGSGHRRASARYALLPRCSAARPGTGGSSLSNHKCHIQGKPEPSPTPAVERGPRARGGVESRDF